MRYRVDTRYGYVSYDETDYDKALALYAADGFRLRRCLDLHDEGVVLEGVPLGVDVTPRASAVAS